MKRLLFIIPMVLMLISGCGKKETGIKLKKDTPAYELAKTLSEKLDYLDPEKNNILASTRTFDLTVGEAIKKLYEGDGKSTDRLKTMKAEQLKPYIDRFINQFAERKLLLDAAQETDISLSQAEIDSMLDLQYKRYGGEAKFDSILAGRDINVEFIKKDIINTATISKYLENTLSDSAKVTEEEIMERYKKDKTASVRHILLMTQGKSDSVKKEIRKKMEGILAEAKSGKDFAELVKKHTEDPGSKNTGGLYKDFGRGKMVKAFEDAAFSVPIGEISDIVETRYGFHILKIVDRKKETEPLEKVRPVIEKELTGKKRNSVTISHLQKLKDDAEFTVIKY
ncbi:peptidylprolyl isomerase [candidate division KSB1 bacterium]|nr:peptidylprolyl isomerase [candidate division KSB1 bacterium]MBL7094530.1 peptidylprolyl isomerase [candidate division KSB1 bacterium]